MPRRRQTNTVGAWFANQIWNTSLPWLLGFFVIGVGFYFTTTSKLEELQIALRDQKSSLIDTKRNDLTEREKVRDAFLADSKSTASGIAELNKQTAVMGATLLGVQKELEKISQRLENVPASIRR